MLRRKKTIWSWRGERFGERSAGHICGLSRCDDFILTKARRRRSRTPIKGIHRADKYDKHTVTDTLQQQLRTMMSAIQGRKAFVQCAILVAVVLLALTANAAAQEHRRHGGRHSPRPHHGHDPWCDHHHCGWPNHSRSRHGKKWRHIGKKWRQAWG